jgi:hypothetical protein
VCRRVPSFSECIDFSYEVPVQMRDNWYEIIQPFFESSSKAHKIGKDINIYQA